MESDNSNMQTGRSNFVPPRREKWPVDPRLRQGGSVEDSKENTASMRLPALKAPPWFWAAVILGALIRAYFVLFTEGTYDVHIWENHATGVLTHGLIGYYHQNIEMNHPPAIAVAITGLLRLSQISGIGFRILLRLPTAFLDAGTALLLFDIFCGSRYRLLIAAAYWLHPLTLIFSAYHGNTDSSIAFFLTACLFLLSKKRIIQAGIVLGISLWIKLPGVLALPAIFFWLPDWEDRLRFIMAAFVVGIMTYLPVMMMDPEVIFRNVLGYGGQIIVTTARVPVWGIQVFFPLISRLSWRWQEHIWPAVRFYYQHNVTIVLAAVVCLSFLRRSKKTVKELGVTVAQSYAILYGLSNFWSFQYFAWSIPFWFFPGKVFFAATTVLAGGYIYALYEHLCGNLLLLGKWDFIGHPYWPWYLLMMRDFAVLFFFAVAMGSIFRAMCRYRAA
ncbi:MAG: hypothetical protein ABSF52_07955 [Syntrophobacteraceae bacterium]